MKIYKYFAMMLLMASTSLALTGCSDDDNLGDAPRLFRPVASLEAQKNNLVATWAKIPGATEYTLTLFKAVDIMPDGTYRAVKYKEATTSDITYTFDNLEWDEKYGITISCKNDTKGSEEYKTGLTTVTYPSKLNKVKAIDNSARLTWVNTSTSTDVIKAIVAIPEDAESEEDKIIRIIKEEDDQNGTYDIVGLKPATTYTFYAYKDAEVFDNSTYAGKLTATTSEPSDFDTQYASNYIDIRNWDPEKAVDTLKTPEFAAMLEEGMTVILRGEQDYKVSNALVFDKSVNFVTGPTLGGNARFISSGGMQCAKGANVARLSFTDIDFYSDKALGDNEVVTNTDKGFGGRQVFNENGTSSTLGELVFKGCHIEGYRAVVRAQADNDNINKIVFDGCVINGIGDQGVVTTNNKKSDMQEITFKNSTLTNIVMVGDLRSTKSAPVLNVTNCTFCYVPMETTANANTPMFRLGTNAAKLNISNTLFGPSMASTGSAGSTIITYTAGPAGSIYVDNQDAEISSPHSYMTNFQWTIVKDKTYPISTLIGTGMSETELWTDPASGNFKLNKSVGEDGIGDPRWYKE